MTLKKSGNSSVYNFEEFLKTSQNGVSRIKINIVYMFQKDKNLL